MLADGKDVIGGVVEAAAKEGADCCDTRIRRVNFDLLVTIDG